ncbi:hypothetical protein JVU11DRAFT_2257 [Chiua virens]|nr:hypothetical protein JVU11DRAFT_2257 [Chiua virens]
MKPDIALLQKDLFDPNGPNSWRHIVSFIELTSLEDLSSLWKQVTRKAYAVFVSQPGRQFLIVLSIFCCQQFRFHLFDHSGIAHSLAYSLHRQADVLLHVLYMLAFAPKEFVGYDPTIFFSPVVD